MGPAPAPLLRLLLLLLLLGVLGGAASGPHSLRYFDVGVSEPSLGVPEYMYVGYVDGNPIMRYDSDSRKTVSRADWMAANLDEQYWNTVTQIGLDSQQANRVNLETARGYYNQSRGAHTWQRMYGCDLLEDGSTRGYFQYAYDGKDYIALDLDTMTFTAADVAAQNTKRKWEKDGTVAERQKHYMENTCIEWLRRYVSYGHDVLERKGERRRGRWGHGGWARVPALTAALPRAAHGAGVGVGGARDPDPALPRVRLLPAAHRRQLAQGRRGQGPGHRVGRHRAQQRRHLLHLGGHRGAAGGPGQVPVPRGSRQPAPAPAVRERAGVQPGHHLGGRGRRRPGCHRRGRRSRRLAVPLREEAEGLRRGAQCGRGWVRRLQQLQQLSPSAQRLSTGHAAGCGPCPGASGRRWPLVPPRWSRRNGPGAPVPLCWSHCNDPTALVPRRCPRPRWRLLWPGVPCPPHTCDRLWLFRSRVITRFFV